MKRDFVLPVLVLSCICLLMTGALALSNAVTRPVITEAANRRAEEAMKEIIPQASQFTPILREDFPGSVAEAYAADGGGAGFIFIVLPSGYGGEITILCGIDPEGKMLKSAVLAHTETQGLGTLVFDKAHQYEGKDQNLHGVDAIAGSTITSRAYRNGIQDAFEAFEMVKEAAP